MLAMAAHQESGTKTVRLEQRTTPETKELIEQAARLQGVKASEFVIAHAAIAARETINRLEVTTLTADDCDAFMRAFHAEPTPSLVELMRAHHEITDTK